MKNNEKKDIKKIIFIIMIILFIIGIGLIIASFYFIISDYLKEQKSVQIDAKIISYTPNNKGSDLEISYEVDNKTYKNKIYYNKQDLTSNDTISIKYNKNNPGIIIKNEHLILIIILISTGIIIFIISGNQILNYKYNIKRVKNLKTQGILIYAKIDEIFFDNKSKKKNNVQPYIVRLKYRNPKDDAVYIYDTNPIYYDIKSLIEKYDIKKVPVYLNPKNTYDYFVDIEQVFPKEV